ncbi:hypothetical protein H8L32_22145 [Undibacterium sp. CY18W]|uniref:Lipoprotein n=1 Tax=Undibacterium hunanense TaxID=2762292 RepID=A0ABR6ZWD5_9BURK|nr:hypothetical protein [Undibacterium hunanense]MBC3920181.1 hypothetical protein [Undibacterium hunanense]
MNKNILTSLPVLAVTLILGACTTPPYVEPQSGNTAEMVVRIQPARGTLFYLNTYDNAESCSGEKTVVSDANRISISKFKFATEKLTTLKYTEMQERSSCTMNISFYGKAKHVYLLNTVTTTGKCSLKLWDATDMKTLVPTPIISRDNGENACPNFKG